MSDEVMSVPYQIDAVRESAGAHHIELSPLEHEAFGKGLPQRGRIDLFIEHGDTAAAWLSAQKSGQTMNVTFALGGAVEDASTHHSRHSRRASATSPYSTSYSESPASSEDDEDDEEVEVEEGQPFGSRNVADQPYDLSPNVSGQPYNPGGLSANQPLTITSSSVGAAREEVNDSPRTPRARQARREGRGE